MVVEGAASDDVCAVSRVPQETVMSPLLLLFYINNLPRNIASQVRLFADDCLLYRPIKTQDDAIVLQQDPERLFSCVL